MGIGAAAVLSVGLLAAGCSEDGDQIIAGAGGNDLLGNTDNIGGLNPVSTNALAPDGGGLSENDADTGIGQLKVVFNCDCCDSDGTFGGDDTAIVLFQSTNTGVAYNRVYATHYNGTFTPPVELTGTDRDDRRAVNLAAYTVIPMNTSAYQTGSTANQDQVNQARANNGNWLILGDYTTFFTDPVLGGAGGNQTTTNARGARRVLGSWLFLNNQRGNAISTVAVGAVTKTFRYGFQKLGEIVNTTFPGGGAGTGNVPATVGASKLAVPANHVTSYGAVTDTFCGQATFGGNALPFSSDASPGDGAYAAPGGLAVGSTAFAFAIPHVSSDNGDPMATNDIANLLGLRTADYHVGEQTNLIVAVWTQICNSFSGGGSFTSSAQTDHQGGHELQLRFRTFNLATMTWENDEAEITGTVERNGATTNLRAGSAPFPAFKVYNNFLFAKYADASLNVEFSGVTNQNLLSLIPNAATGDHDWFQTEVGGHEGGNIVPAAGGNNRPGFWEEIIMAVRFVDDGDGTASVSTKQDISSTAETRSAVGQHTTTNPTITSQFSSVGDTYPDREMANFNGTGTSILGPDQGLGDITVFMIVSDGTNTTANVNIDRELIAAGLNTDGTPVTGTNPVRISGTHQEDYHGQAAGNNSNPGADASGTNEQNNRTSLEDPLVIRGAENGAGGNNRNVASFTLGSYGPTWFELVINRTGEWAAIAFIKDTGLSCPTTGTAGSFSQDLHAVAYQTFRPATTGTGSTSTAAALNARFAGPTVINAQNLTPPVLPGNRQGYPTTNAGSFSSTVTNDADSFGNWRSLPVNDYRWQGGLGYRCGVQSDKDVLSIVYEQSDGTEDRVFLRQMRITPGTTGTPTLALTGTASVEVDASEQIASHRSFNEATPGQTAIFGGATFRFIDETAQIENWETIDSGLNSAGTGGECLVVYRKITDNTNTDGDHADASLRALLFTGTAITGPIAIDNNVDENAAPQAGGGDNDQNTPLVSGNQGVNGLFANVAPQVLAVTVTPRNTDITNAPSFPNANAKVTIGIVLRDREINVTTTAGVNTVTANASSRRALYTVIFRNDDNALAFNGRFVPSMDPAARDFPLQIDHEQGIVDDTTFVRDSLKNGGVWWIIMETNNQLWLQELTITANTVTRTFVTTGTGTGSFSAALSNPALITNDSTSDVQGQDVKVCEDANGVQKAILIFYTKFDRDGTTGDERLQVRSGGA